MKRARLRPATVATERTLEPVADDQSVRRAGVQEASQSEASWNLRLVALRADLVSAVSRVCPLWLANEREDIVQLALTKLSDKASREGTTLDFSASYLRRVAYTHVVDEIRRRRRRRESSLEVVEGASDLFVSNQPSPEASSASHELRTAIEGCLGCLSAPRRNAMVLSLLGYSYLEIAEKLGWNCKRAENMVTRARKELRECLARKGFER